MRKWFSRVDEGKTILRYSKRAATISFFFLLLGARVLAQDDLNIDADSVEYNKERGYVEAFGNVVATYEDMRVDSPHVIYYSAKKKIVADQGFVMTITDQRISGRALDYDIEGRTGTAEDVIVDFKGVHLKGKLISMSPDLITLDGSEFTSCGSDPPDYHITASNLTLHPKLGWLAAYWGWFYLGPVPLLPVPTYIYDIGPAGKRVNMAPLPEIGSNDVDGTYGIERLAWTASERVYGRVSLTYATKKGPGGGVDCNYIADDVNSYYARINTSEKDGWWGGLTYTRFLGGDVERGMFDQSMYNLFNLPKDKKMELRVNGSSRERINYKRVSYLPEVSLMLNDDFWGEHLKYGGEARWAKVLEEETTLEAHRTSLSGHLTYLQPVVPTIDLTFGSSLTGRWYSERSHWNQISGFVQLDKTWSDIFSTDYGYRHYFINDGGSPFAFEQYWFRPDDQVYTDARLKLGDHKLGVGLEYYISSWDPKDIDYSASLRLHCFDVIVTYRAMRKEVTFGLNLVTEQ